MTSVYTPSPHLRWLVLSGGLASAAAAVVLSRHRTQRRALAALARARRAGNRDLYVAHADAHEAALRGGTEAVQALAGKVRT